MATSKRTNLAERLLDHVGLARKFAGIYGSEPEAVGHTKTALLGYILAQQAIAPARAVMIGDRQDDVAAAHANAMRSVGVSWGYGTVAELRDAGADTIAHTAAELPGIVAQWRGDA